MASFPTFSSSSPLRFSSTSPIPSFPFLFHFSFSSLLIRCHPHIFNFLFYPLSFSTSFLFSSSYLLPPPQAPLRPLSSSPPPPPLHLSHPIFVLYSGLSSTMPSAKSPLQVVVRARENREDSRQISPRSSPNSST